jgi:hypothetical protein
VTLFGGADTRICEVDGVDRFQKFVLQDGPCGEPSDSGRNTNQLAIFVSPQGRLSKSGPGSSIELSAELVGTGREDLVCFSTVRWSASARRARLVLARAAIHRRVFYIEPPRCDTERSYIEVTGDAFGVRIAIPHIPRGARSQDSWNLVRSFLRAGRVRKFISCYYTASQISFSASPDGWLQCGDD